VIVCHGAKIDRLTGSLHRMLQISFDKGELALRL
jgi:hypothetical protein